MAVDRALLTDQDDVRFLVGKFEDSLAATATRGAGLDRVGSADCRDCDDASSTGGDHCTDRVRFSTGPFGKGSILDIAARVNPPVFVDQRRADPVPGIRRMRVLANFRRRVHESLLID